MTKIMTPYEAGITTVQIGKIQEVLGAALRKSGFQSESVQQIIETQGDSLTAEFVGVLRKRVEAVSKMIVRRVKVDRSQTSQQAFDATGRKQYTDREVVDAMPRGEGEEVDVYFFDLNYDPTVQELDHEYELRGLKADPIAQAKVNTDDPAFADDRPNGCQWGLEKGVASFAAFDRWVGGRRVDVGRDDDGWYRGYRFGGVRK
mgnify:CR=1 FL=1